MRELKGKNVMPQLAVRDTAHGAQHPHPAIVIGGPPPVGGAVATYGAPDPAVAARDPARDPVIVTRDRDARLRSMVDRYLDFVARVLKNAGTPDAEIDDEVQRTFITAARRLDDVRPGAEKGFLFKIALNLAARAHAFLRHRGYVTPEDVKAVGPDVPRHRLVVHDDHVRERNVEERQRWLHAPARLVHVRFGSEQNDVASRERGLRVRAGRHRRGRGGR